MESLANYLTKEQVEELKGMTPKEITDLVVKIKKHFGNPVYNQAREMYEQTQLAQIRKGAEKYPEPLNPASWTVDQLTQHAFDEAVDLTHYITSMKVKGEQLEKDLEAALHVIDQAAKQIKDHYNESEYWRKRALSAESERNELESKNKTLMKKVWGKYEASGNE